MNILIIFGSIINRLGIRVVAGIGAMNGWLRMLHTKKIRGMDNHKLGNIIMNLAIIKSLKFFFFSSDFAITKPEIIKKS